MNETQTKILRGKDEIRAFLRTRYPSLAVMDEIELERIRRFQSLGIDFPPHGLIFLDKPKKITENDLRLFGFMAGKEGGARVENEMHRLYFRTDIFDLLSDKRIYDVFCDMNNLPKNILESSQERSLVLSVRWCDMLMASNYSSFTSCIAIPFDGQKDYSGGGRMYAQSLNTMILYWIKNSELMGFAGDGHSYEGCDWPRGRKMTGRRFGVITDKSYGFLREYGTLKIGVFPAMELFAEKTKLKLSAHFEPAAEKKVEYAKYLDKLGKHLNEFHPLELELSEKYEAWGTRLGSSGESVEFRPCCKCGKRTNTTRQRIYYADDKEIGEAMCNACHEKETFHCPKCGKRRPATVKTIFSGADLCLSCEKTTVARCSCGVRLWADQMYATPDGYKCEECAKPYRKCEFCSVYHLKNDMVNYGKRWYCPEHDPLASCDCGNHDIHQVLKLNKFSGPVAYCAKHPKVGFAYFDPENFADKWKISKILETRTFLDNVFVRCAEGWVHFNSGLLATESKDFKKFAEVWEAAAGSGKMNLLPIMNEVAEPDYYGG